MHIYKELTDSTMAQAKLLVMIVELCTLTYSIYKNLYNCGYKWAWSATVSTGVFQCQEGYKAWSGPRIQCCGGYSA